MPQRKGVKAYTKVMGGKSQLLAALFKVFDYVVEEHDLTGLLDLFCGTNMIQTCYAHPYIEFRLANEIDRGVYALHCCMQDPDKVEDLLDQIQLVADSEIFTEAVFEAFKHELETTPDEVAAAAMTYVVTEYSRAANRQDYCHANVDRGINIGSVAKKFYAVEGVLEDMVFTNTDYEEQFHEYKHREDYLFVIDPPYCQTDAKGKTKATAAYRHEFKPEDQEKLIENLLSDDLKAKVILCGYENSLYEKFTDSGKYQRYFIGEVTVSSSSTGRKRNEYIWVNFEVPDHALPPVPFDGDEYLLNFPTSDPEMRDIPYGDLGE